MEDGKIVHISGAGPAGLAAAMTIARSGARAVVFEAQQEVGGRFHDDFQGLENWTTRGDVLEELDSIGVRPSFDYRPYHEVVFFSPGGREFRQKSQEPIFYLVRRGPNPGSLDHSLKNQAQDLGVEIRFSRARHHFPAGGVVAEGPHRADGVAVGYVFETQGCDGVFGALSDQLAPKGYSYLLIHSGRGTIASCIFNDFHNEKIYLDRTVEFFRQKTGVSMGNPRRFGGIAAFDSPRTACKGNILYTGESAGFQDALWGFGMRYAFLSGHFASRALLAGSAKGYDRLWKDRIGGLIGTSIVNRFLYEKLGDGGYLRFMKGLKPGEDFRRRLYHYYRPSFWKKILLPFVRNKVGSKSRKNLCLMEGCDCTWCRCQHALKSKDSP